jgi:hypothetical protein
MSNNKVNRYIINFNDGVKNCSKIVKGKTPDAAIEKLKGDLPYYRLKGASDFVATLVDNDFTK